MSRKRISSIFILFTLVTQSNARAGGESTGATIFSILIGIIISLFTGGLGGVAIRQNNSKKK